MNRALVVLAIFAASAVLTADESQPKARPEAGPSADDSMIGKEAGRDRDDNALDMKLVWCPPGFVTMEDVDPDVEVAAEPDDAPEDRALAASGNLYIETRRARGKPVRVFLTKGYWLGRYEVTQSQWQRLMKTEPWKGQESTKEGPDFPATYVDWNDATAFCRKMTEQERAAGRLPQDWEYTLPTEAQWERACRARTETRFSFGDDESQIGDYAWFIANTVNAREDYAHPVGQKKPNAWGLHDMHGNVWEWCRDSHQRKLPGGRDPEVNERGAERVLRGGGIYRDADDCRSAYRNNHAPNWRLFDLGFRVALVWSGTKPRPDAIR